jgi:hypothetical protein
MLNEPVPHSRTVAATMEMATTASGDADKMNNSLDDETKIPTEGDYRRGDDGNGEEEKVNSLDIETATATMTTQDQDSTVTVMSQEISPPPPPSRNCCCGMWHYGDNGNMMEARGYALLAMGESKKHRPIVS